MDANLFDSTVPDLIQDSTRSVAALMSHLVGRGCRAHRKKSQEDEASLDGRVLSSIRRDTASDLAHRYMVGALQSMEVEARIPYLDYLVPPWFQPSGDHGFPLGVREPWDPKVDFLLGAVDGLGDMLQGRDGGSASVVAAGPHGVFTPTELLREQGRENYLVVALNSTSGSSEFDRTARSLVEEVRNRSLVRNQVERFLQSGFLLELTRSIRKNARTPPTMITVCGERPAVKKIYTCLSKTLRKYVRVRSVFGSSVLAGVEAMSGDWHASALVSVVRSTHAHLLAIAARLLGAGAVYAIPLRWEKKDDKNLTDESLTVLPQLFRETDFLQGDARQVSFSISTITQSATMQPVCFLPGGKLGVTSLSIQGGKILHSPVSLSPDSLRFRRFPRKPPSKWNGTMPKSSERGYYTVLKELERYIGAYEDHWRYTEKGTS